MSIRLLARVLALIAVLVLTFAGSAGDDMGADDHGAAGVTAASVGCGGDGCGAGAGGLTRHARSGCHGPAGQCVPPLIPAAQRDAAIALAGASDARDPGRAPMSGLPPETETPPPRA